MRKLFGKTGKRLSVEGSGDEYAQSSRCSSCLNFAPKILHLPLTTLLNPPCPCLCFRFCFRWVCMVRDSDQIESYFQRCRHAYLQPTQFPKKLPSLKLDKQPSFLTGGAEFRGLSNCLPRKNVESRMMMFKHEVKESPPL